MKEQAITKINKIGKISSILTLVCKVFVIIGMVFCLAGALICFVIPDQLVSITVTPTLEVDVDYSVVGHLVSPEEQAMLDDSQMEEELKQEFATDEELAGMTVSIENQVIRMSEVEEGITLTMHDLAWLALMAFMVTAMTFITLLFVGRLCKAFRDCSSPFEHNVICKMQHLAYSLIPWALLSIIWDTVIESISTNRLSFMFSIDLGVILTVILVLVLVYIFKYGAVLQQESDETL